MTTATTNEKATRLASLLTTAGLKFKEVETYGRQVVVTCWCKESAQKVANLLKQGGFTFRGITHSVDYTQDKTAGTQDPNTHEVWRAFLCV